MPFGYNIITFQVTWYLRISSVISGKLPEMYEKSVAVINAKMISITHDNVIKWKNFPRYWPFVRGIYRSPVNSPHKSQWRGALMFSLVYAWTNSWANNGDANDLKRHHAYYDVTVMLSCWWPSMVICRYGDYWFRVPCMTRAHTWMAVVA